MLLNLINNIYLYYMELPKISLLTPTYNRRDFKPLLECNIKNLNYPKELLEHIIFDDHENKFFKDNNELIEFEKNTNVKVKYIYKNNKHYSIGEKRNILVKESNYKILFNMDDDDIYPSNGLLISLKKMFDTKCSLVGTNQMQFIYPLNDYKISFIKCKAKRQIHESGMLFKKKHWRSMGGFCKQGNGEGSKMIDFNEKHVQNIEVCELLICVAHETNTVCKDRFLENEIKINLNEDSPYLKILKQIFNN